jgi:hypothetical protein
MVQAGEPQPQIALVNGVGRSLRYTAGSLAGIANAKPATPLLLIHADTVPVLFVVCFSWRFDYEGYD